MKKAFTGADMVVIPAGIPRESDYNPRRANESLIGSQASPV